MGEVNTQDLPAPAAVLARLRRAMACDSRDWALDRKDTVLYALLVGWECEGKCDEQDDPEHTCDGAIREVADRHGWSVRQVDELRSQRAALRALYACPRPIRVDGPEHSWKFDGDDPYTVCVGCGEIRDALTGRTISR